MVPNLDDPRVLSGRRVEISSPMENNLRGYPRSFMRRVRDRKHWLIVSSEFSTNIRAPKLLSLAMSYVLRPGSTT